MDAASRRKYILDTIDQHSKPISASTLAKALNVSRQVVVGDVALLRAQGQEIIATARGYIIPNFSEANQYIGKIACQHNPNDTQKELYIIVDLNAVVINVTVEHEVYGEITGSLNLTNRKDVDAFVGRVKASEVVLLSELTNGIHLHTIACKDKIHFEAVSNALGSAGFLCF